MASSNRAQKAVLSNGEKRSQYHRLQIAGGKANEYAIGQKGFVSEFQDGVENKPCSVTERDEDSRWQSSGKPRTSRKMDDKFIALFMVSCRAPQPLPTIQRAHTIEETT